MSLRVFGQQSPVRWENLVERLSPLRGGLLRRSGLDTSSKTIQPTRPAGPFSDIFVFLIFSFLLFSCTTSTPQITPQIVTVYSTSAAQPWLDPLYACAGSTSVVARVDDSSKADIILRVGEPEFLVSSAYQIDTEDILIITHRQSPVQNLTIEEARALFAGQGDPAVQVWVYAAEEDVQLAFDQFVMEGRSVTPAARLAVNPQQMSDTLVNELNTVGILPRHWKMGDVRDVYLAATVPVLALTKSEPQGAVKQLVACLQK
jgi:hypothetical protein